MRLFWLSIVETVFNASVFFLVITVLLEWKRPGFVVLYIPLVWILVVVFISGGAVAILKKK